MPVNSALAKAARLLQIEALLLAHPEGLTQAELARRLGVNRSTIYRYLPDLVGPVYQEGRKLFIDREAYLVNVRFSLHEAVAVHLAARLLAARQDRQNPHAASALRKLGLSLEKLAPRISIHLQQSADTMDGASRQQDPVYLKALERLSLAWASQVKARICYKPESSTTARTYVYAVYFIEPYAVGQSTYVIGYSEPQAAMRTLKIERIVSVDLLDEHYEIPPDFDPTKLLSGAWGIWYTERDPIRVKLRFSPRVAGRVRATQWHRSEETCEGKDGYLIWEAQIAEPQEMMPWIRGWGAEVEVLEPDYLHKELRDEVLRMMALYGLEAR
ncbi:MAG: WYL domain-containing protein [Chloroflexi bacterium]|nr:WYL domain-containing protein [Chloroflexota bacterium]